MNVSLHKFAHENVNKHYKIHKMFLFNVFGSRKQRKKIKDSLKPFSFYIIFFKGVGNIISALCTGHTRGNNVNMNE